MRRGTALDIAQRVFATGQKIDPSMRDEIIATQMPEPMPPEHHTAFCGWTIDERLAFYRDGTIPQRYRA